MALIYPKFIALDSSTLGFLARDRLTNAAASQVVELLSQAALLRLEADRGFESYLAKLDINGLGRSLIPQNARPPALELDLEKVLTLSRKFIPLDINRSACKFF
jgi:hypothetical protein